MATSPAQLRYLADAVNTASPAQRVVMLYDRLVLDVRRAADASGSGDRAQTSEQLRHAQLIVAELRASLHLDAWSGADDLASLYGFLLSELIALNLDTDAERFTRVLDIVTGLRDSWRDASAVVQRANAAAAQRSGLVPGDPSASTDGPPAPRQVAWVG